MTTSGVLSEDQVAALLDRVVELGARRARLTAAIVGGAQMFGNAGELQVGARNEEAVRAALHEARLPVAGAETGGSVGRTIRVYLDAARVTSRVAGGSETVLLGGPAVTA